MLDVINGLNTSFLAWHFHIWMFYLHLFKIGIPFKDNFVIEMDDNSSHLKYKSTGFKKEKGVTVTCQIGDKLHFLTSESDELYCKSEDPDDRSWGQGEIACMGRRGTFCSDGGCLCLDGGGCYQDVSTLDT